VSPVLVGVGVGPGDPELVTVKAVRILREADLVVLPVTDAGDTGRAEATVAAHMDVSQDRVRRLRFAITGDRDSAWDAAGREVADAYAAGAETVAFATIGDPNVYSTFTYLAATVRELVAGLVVETVPGITAMQDLAARSGTVLVEGAESLALLPITAGVEAFEAALGTADTVVAYKGGRHLPSLREVLARHDRLADAVYGAALGLPGEDVRPAAETEGVAPYLSTVLVPARRHTRGGKL